MLNSLMSTSIFSVSKRMDVRTRNLFELLAESIGLAINVALALTLRNVWAPILGIVLTFAVRSALTYFLRHPPHRFLLDKVHAPAIFHFSKWIMLSSLAFYAAVYVDRLFLGRVVPLAVLGVYGLAKSISDLPNAVAGRLAFQIVFPFVANRENDLSAGSPARAELARARRNFLLLVLVGIATIMAWSDRAVLILYGPKFAAGGWMLCFLLVGGWIAVLSSLNEATVFGRGEPHNVGFANVTRFLVMAAALPAGFAMFGLHGVFLAMPASELTRYGILMRAQQRLNLTFRRQDMVLSLWLAAIFAGWLALRMALGLGLPWAMMG